MDDVGSGGDDPSCASRNPDSDGAIHDGDDDNNNN